MTKLEHPWNWCKTCEEPVDVGDDVSDGTEVFCPGCGIAYTVTEFQDTGFELLPVVEVDIEVKDDPDESDPDKDN